VRNNAVTPKNFSMAKKLIAEEGLTVEVLKPKSEAAATFIEFAINIIDFSETIAKVGPMEEELKDLTKKLFDANESARLSQEKVDDLNAKLKTLIDR